VTTSTAPAQLISRDARGIVCMLLSGTGVVFLPTTAKLAYESASDVLTVAFSRGIIAVLILLSAAIIVQQNLRLPRDMRVHSIVVGIAALVMFEKLARNNR
jgi:drug/metabolite transporter (DMT)-like permease